MAKTTPDHYALLGIARTATLTEIKRAYRELVRRNHPDAAGDDPKARSQFEALQAAYEVLSDSSRRAEYDQTLPARKSPVVALDADMLWREATETILERSDSFSPMIEAMRTAVPIALEDDLLVVGIEGKDQYLAGHLETPANRHRIAAVLKEISSRDVEFRMIEGSTREDWDFVKRAETRRAQAAPPPPPTPTATARTAQAGAEPARPMAPQVTVWELLGRKIQNTWQGTSLRQHPLVRAEFLMKCVNWIVETSNEATDEGQPRDVIHREQGRAIERVAQLLEVPTTVIAMEVIRPNPRRRPL